jgi:hypothetical protein
MTLPPRRWVLLLAGLVFLAGGVAQARPGRIRERTIEAPWARVHVPVLKEHMGAGDAVVRCRVTDIQGEWPTEALTLHYRIRGAWRRVHFSGAKEPGQPDVGAGAVFEAAIPNAGRGVAVPYYVQLELAPGQPLRMPGNAPTSTFTLTFKGQPSGPLIAAHVLCMMGGLLPLLAAMVCAILFLPTGRFLAAHRRLSLIGFVLLFIGSVPLGIAVERQVFGTYWEGWPFGRDVTDTKTGVILLFWLILMLFRGRSLWSRLPATRGPSDRAWAGWLIGIAVFTVAMYLIPHENLKF